MSYRLRAAFCVLSACVLSACGGGGDSSMNELLVETEAGPDAYAAATPSGTELFVLKGSTEAVTSTASQQAYAFSLGTPGLETFGGITVGYIPLVSDAVKVSFGYAQGNASKFFLSAEVPGSQTIYECISAGWTNADKLAITAEYKYVPPTCDSGITFTPANDGSGQLVINKANIPGTGGQKLVLKIRTTIPPLSFSSGSPT